jgi:chemotaxis methyl-accepting protein methylase
VEAIGPKDDDADFAELKRRLVRLTGWDLNRFKENYLRRRVGARVRALGCPDWKAYGDLLDRDPGELERLRDRLTVNVTEFFRDPDVWEEIRERVLPRLLEAAAKRPKRELRLWSAGCSSGEEAYSLAMLAREAARRQGKDVAVRVLASDLDSVALERAKAGRYPAAAFAHVPPTLQAAWFEPDGDGYRAGAALRSTVAFRVLDLFTSPAPPELDLILCRNVMIYFTRDLQQKLLRAFHQALVPGGIYVTGKTETLLGPARAVFRSVSARSRIFERI